MSASMLLFCLWVAGANVAAMLPSRRNQLPAVLLPIAAGIPILGYVTLQHGPAAGMLAMAAGAAILRWPARHLSAWVDRRTGRAE